MYVRGVLCAVMRGRGADAMRLCYALMLSLVATLCCALCYAAVLMMFLLRLRYALFSFSTVNWYALCKCAGLCSCANVIFNAGLCVL
jgi:hypothetical protein